MTLDELKQLADEADRRGDKETAFAAMQQMEVMSKPQSMNPIDKWSTTPPKPIENQPWDYQHPFGNGTPLGGWIGANSQQRMMLQNSPAMQGVKDAYQGLRQRIWQAGDFLGMTTPGSTQNFTNAANQERAAYEQTPQAQRGTSGIERFTGNVLPYLAVPAGGGFVSGALQGAGTAAASFDPYGKTVIDNPAPVIASAVLGGFLSKIGNQANRPDILKLKKEGIEPSVGQIMGGGIKAAEDRATSVPLIGDWLKKEQSSGVQQLNTAVLNRALKPSGATIPQGLVGRDAVTAAEQAITNKYDVLLPQLSAQADKQFVQGLTGIKGIVQNASDDVNNQLAKIVKNEIVDKFKNSGGKIDGETFKGIESTLGQITSSIRSNPSSSWDQHLMADALDEAKTQLRDLLTRSNPELAPELQKLNQSWANYDRLRRASAMDKIGLGFSPLQLQAAVKAADKSKNKGAFAKGQALMQDLSDPAYRVFGGTYPDSGTAGRIAQYVALHNQMYWPLLAASAPFVGLNLPIIKPMVLGASRMRNAPAIVGTGIGNLNQ